MQARAPPAMLHRPPLVRGASPGGPRRAELEPREVGPRPRPLEEAAEAASGNASEMAMGKIATYVARPMAAPPTPFRPRANLSQTGSDVSASYQPTATVTKSGRSIQKPAQFNPAADQMSPSAPSTNKRKRNPQKVGAEGQLCVKCSRGHSPTHNQVVFCDGCNDAWHQWCHEPKIPKDVVEIPDKEWICVNCHDKREMENLPIGNRIGNQVLNLSLDDQKRYLLSLPHKTLVRLLLHSLEATPNLPIFAPNTRDLLRKLDAEEDEVSDIPSARSPSKPRLINRQDGHVPPPEPDDNDPYPDYSNPAGDPPATYPRPGHGHIPLQPTTDPQFLNRLVDDNFEVYSHSYDDGTGLKPIARTEKEGAWIQRDTGRGASASQALGARINGHSHALSLPGAEPDAEGDEEEADDDGRGDDVDMEPTMFDGAEPDA